MGVGPTATCTGLEKQAFYRVICLSGHSTYRLGVHELQDNDLSGFSRHSNKTRFAVQSLRPPQEKVLLDRVDESETNQTSTRRSKNDETGDRQFNNEAS